VAKLGTTGRLARENAMRSPRRTSATAAALTIGVFVVGFIATTAASATDSIRGTVDKSFVGDFVVQSNTGFQGGLPPEVAADIADLPEVAAVAQQRQGVAEVDGSGTFLSAISGDTFEDLADVDVVEGSLADLETEGTIAVEKRTADDKGWSLGDTVAVTYPDTGPQELRIAATYDRSEVLGDYTTGLATYDANNTVRFDSFVYVKLADGVSPSEGRAAISTVTDPYPNAELQDKDEFADSIVGQIQQLVFLIYVLLLLAVGIAIIGIINTLALSVYERTRELGLLRAVGMTRAQMRATVRWESVIIAVLGTLLGLVLGLVFGWALVSALGDEGFTTFTVPVGVLVFVVILAALAGVLAAIVPARRAANLNVLQAISTE
jgi:putative ABC transport system permease protein